MKLNILFHAIYNYRLAYRLDWGSTHKRGNNRNFSPCCHIQTSSVAHPPSCLMGTGGPYPRGKVASA